MGINIIGKLEKLYMSKTGTPSKLKEIEKLQIEYKDLAKQVKTLQMNNKRLDSDNRKLVADYQKLEAENKAQTNRLNTYLGIVDALMKKDEIIVKQADYIGQVSAQVDAMEREINILKEKTSSDNQ